MLSDQLYKYVEPKTGQKAPLISDPNVYQFIQKYANELNSAITCTPVTSIMIISRIQNTGAIIFVED